MRALGFMRHYANLNKQAPDFELYTTDSIRVSHEDFKGKITFLNIWHFNCSPCLAEIPALNRLYEKYQEDEDVQFYSMFLLDIKKTGSDSLFFQSYNILASKEEYNYLDIKIPQLPNAREVVKKYSGAYPTNLLIDQHGIIRYIQVGASLWDDNSKLVNAFTQEIEQLKKEKI